MKKREESKIDQAKHKATLGHTDKKQSMIGDKSNNLLASIANVQLAGQEPKQNKKDHIPKNYSSLS